MSKGFLLPVGNLLLNIAAQHHCSQISLQTLQGVKRDIERRIHGVYIDTSLRALTKASRPYGDLIKITDSGVQFTVGQYQRLQRQLDLSDMYVPGSIRHEYLQTIRQAKI